MVIPGISIRTAAKIETTIVILLFIGQNITHILIKIILALFTNSTGHI
jgi:hypothetical protein